MINTGRITILENEKVVLVIPTGISSEQRSFFSRLNPQVMKFENGEISTERFGITDKTDLNLLKYFDSYKKIALIKNPYWRVLEIYFWNFLYGENPLKIQNPTFKKVIYEDLKNTEVSRYFHQQEIFGVDNFIFCENFREDFWKYFKVDCGSELRYILRITDSSSLYDKSLPTFSHFYDSELAKIVYEKHQQIFERFNYDYYSYLDYFNPIDKIHYLHGSPKNKFEEPSIYLHG